LPELLERLARVRLRGRVGQPQVGQTLDLAATS